MSFNQPASFDVLNYSKANLANVIGKTLAIEISGFEIYNRLHFQYLHAYLSHEGARTLIAEYDFTDRFYLDDYADVHVRSFRAYGRTCTRIHFFDKTAVGSRAIVFDKVDFEALLVGNSSEMTLDKFQQGYLGYVVIRPLPNAMIGRTCLSVYKVDKNAIKNKTENSQILAVQRVEVNLFGINLIIEETLPFQEQDSNISAFASSALWSFCHAATRSSHLAIPSPSTISKQAINNNPHYSGAVDKVQAFDIPTVNATIESFGLTPFIYRVTDTDDLKEIIYAYQSQKAEPVLLAVEVYQRSLKDKKYELKDDHLLTVVGFNYNKQPAHAIEGSNFSNRAWAIDSLYAHDNEIGPFARLSIDSVDLETEFSDEIWAQYKPEEKQLNDTQSDELKNTQIDDDDPPWAEYFPLSDVSNEITILRPMVFKTPEHGGEPVNVIDDIIYVPISIHLGLYHRIRCHFDTVSDLARYIEDMLDQYGHFSPQDCTWDLALIDIKKYKNQLIETLREIKHSEKNNEKHSGLKKSYLPVLQTHLPRLIWRLSLYESNTLIFDIIVDASEGGLINHTILDVVRHDIARFDKFTANIKKASAELKYNSGEGDGKISHADNEFDADEKFAQLSYEKFIQIIQKNQQRPSLSLADENFGVAVLPSRIKDFERNEHGVYNRPNKVYRITSGDNYINDEENSVTLGLFDKKKTYLWLIMANCDILIAEEEVFSEVSGEQQQLGHPTLNDGKEARIAGEIKLTGGHWVISNASGRYSKGHFDRTKTQLTNVLMQLKSRDFIAEGMAIEINFSEYHTANKHTTLNGFLDAIGIINIKSKGQQFELNTQRFNEDHVDRALLDTSLDNKNAFGIIKQLVNWLADLTIEKNITSKAVDQLLLTLYQYFDSRVIIKNENDDFFIESPKQKRMDVTGDFNNVNSKLYRFMCQVGQFYTKTQFDEYRYSKELWCDLAQMLFSFDCLRGNETKRLGKILEQILTGSKSTTG